MNINYHYFTVKTLAAAAGFSPEQAQCIAYFSQQIDDFILGGSILLHKKPPQFFEEQGLAVPAFDSGWYFYPCSTGIDLLRSISHSYQRQTLVPFHFIPSKPLPEIETVKNVKREEYRCVPGDNNKAQLIYNLVNQAVDMVRNEKSTKNLMRLGMILHTYADTYAHCYFSGMHGWENDGYLSYAYDKGNQKNAMNPQEIFFYRNLPSIGHSNIGNAPDICSYKIAYVLKYQSEGKGELRIERDNTEYYGRCSRAVLDFLCKSNKKPAFNNSDWDSLQKRIVKAQFTEKEGDHKTLESSWHAIFPENEYYYDKRCCFGMSLRMEQGHEKLLKKMQAKDFVVLDAYSEKGNRYRNAALISLKEANQFFYDYNELAYQQVFAVTGSYAGSAAKEAFMFSRNLEKELRAGILI